MHRFPGRQIRKCVTTLAWQPCHHPSINQLCDMRMHTESTCTHKCSHHENVEICWCNVMSFTVQYTAEREMVRNRLKGEELNMTPRKTCWRLGSPHFSPYFCSFDRHWMFVRCHIKFCSVFEDRWGQEATIWAGGWRWRRNKRSRQMKKWYL